MTSLLITYGAHTAVFPSASTYRRSASELLVMMQGRPYSFPSDAKVSEASGGEIAVAPGQPVPELLRQRQPDEITGAATSRHTMACSTIPQIDACIGGGGSGGGSTDPTPAFFSTDQIAGVASSFTATSSSLDFQFSNPFGSTDYNYSYTLYDQSGTALYISPAVQATLIGSNGDIWVSTSGLTAIPYWRAQFVITLTSGRNAAPGNAHATGH